MLTVSIRSSCHVHVSVTTASWTSRYCMVYCSCHSAWKFALQNVILLYGATREISEQYEARCMHVQTHIACPYTLILTQAKTMGWDPDFDMLRFEFVRTDRRCTSKWGMGNGGRPNVTSLEHNCLSIQQHIDMLTVHGNRTILLKSTAFSRHPKIRIIWLWCAYVVL